MLGPPFRVGTTEHESYSYLPQCLKPVTMTIHDPMLKHGPSESLRLKRSVVVGPLLRVGTTENESYPT